ncbi:MAG: 4-hydroxythreonine-4-phosphate dehydrogenase [Sulfurovaceae bacterium]|nr:4-hydroxythreonine-4-phosphate dehydrogenase [Sulfurovaceae bacterium]MDD5548218.1 4-hydroxythreonine-4-phosphate dehydrogenase [Sulfurovaceae bacterium]
MKNVAISVGDLNGIGIELILRNHDTISKIVHPIYIIDNDMLLQASKLLDMDIPSNFNTISPNSNSFNIKAGEITKESGAYSFSSFKKAVELAKNSEIDAICTLPIHKKAWELAGIPYKGHTDALRDFCQMDAIMMLGCPKLYVALFTEHIPLKDVPSYLTFDRLNKFLLDFYSSAKPNSIVGVIGLNPHAGDGGVLGNEEEIIKSAIDSANNTIGKNIYNSTPLVPDIAFSPNVRKEYKYLVAMYHDQGLAPLKALYFDESINVSLNLPFLRTSVDHGTAFDKAYKKVDISSQSYINAIKYITI